MITLKHIQTDSLSRLLLEEYKQCSLFKDLGKKGIDLNKVGVNNFDIVLDMIGFPEDGYIDGNGKSYSRKRLFDEFHKVCTLLYTKQGVVVTHEGLLDFKMSAETSQVELALLQFTEWLISELAELENSSNYNSSDFTPIKIGNWLINKEGIKWDGQSHIFIEKERLLDFGSMERRYMYDWLIHLPEKDFITEEDTHTLNTAFILAAKLYGLAFNPYCYSWTLGEQQNKNNQ